MKHQYNMPIYEYINQLAEFLMVRIDISKQDITDMIHLETIGHGDTEKIKSVRVSIEKEKFKSNPYLAYQLKIRETIYPTQRNNCETKKFSYELMGVPNDSEIIRFDFNDSYTLYPKYHINANPDVWGKSHLLYPQDTNIDLSKMNGVIALNMFEKFVHHQDKHILDIKNNDYYLSLMG